MSRAGNNWFAESEKIRQTFKPKTGPNKHWFYKHIDDVTPEEMKQADAYFEVFFNEWRAIMNNIRKTNERDKRNYLQRNTNTARKQEKGNVEPHGRTIDRQRI